MSKPIDKVIYDRAAALIAKGWTQDVSARNADGEAVSPLAKTAVRFSADGAIWRAAFEVTGDKIKSLIVSEYKLVPTVHDLNDFNDSPDATPEAICEVFRTLAK